MAVITIIGAGMMGTALCWPLSDNGHQVRLVGTPLDGEIIARLRSDRFHLTLQRTIPEGVVAYPVDELQAALQGAELVVGGISSFGIPWFAEIAGRHFRPGLPVISVTKGLEDTPEGALLALPDALDRRLPPDLQGRVSFNAIGGPCIAHELAARRHTAVVFCGRDQALLEHIRSLFAAPYYHIWPSTDLVGVEVCAALKNAYALGVSLAMGMLQQAGPDGLAHMYNPQAALFGQSIHEMGRLLHLLGASTQSLHWLPAPGDLFVTVFGGRTMRLGVLLGSGLPYAEARQVLSGLTLESVEIVTRTARALRALAERRLADLSAFPLLLHLDAILNHSAPVSIPWDAFFK